MTNQRRLKILHVVLSLEPGGMENGVVNVARGLDQKQFEVHVACLERGGSFIDRLPEPQNVYILNKKPGFSWRTVFALRKTIAKIKPDVIHTHNLGPLIYAALATMMGLTGKILHGEHGFPQSQRTPDSLRQRRFFYRACKRVHAVSQGLHDELVQFGMPEKKIEVVVNGVDTDRFAPFDATAARNEVKLPIEGPIVGMVGRFDPLKCHLALIAAFEGLSQKLPTAQLLIVGHGGQIYEQVLARGKNSPVANRIHMVGFQPEPKRYYQSMDLLVVPSLSEGMSNVVLEAMSCGVPVLGHTACGNAEIITTGKDGILANLKTPKELEKEIIAALQNPRLKPIGTAARETILTRFSIATMVENYANLYRRVANL